MTVLRADEGEGPLVRRLGSEGGVSLELPAAWAEFFADEHLAVFRAPRTATSHEAFAPVCVIDAAPGHGDLATWWEGLQETVDGPLLLAAEERDDGFAATFAQVVAGTSVTGRCRCIRLPGKALTVTVQFASGDTLSLLDVADRIMSSVEVEGLP